MACAVRGTIAHAHRFHAVILCPLRANRVGFVVGEVARCGRLTPILDQGHSDGGKRLGEFLEWCMEAGVAMATAFAFSTENWKRDAHEVSVRVFTLRTRTLPEPESGPCCFLTWCPVPSELGKSDDL